MARSGSVEARSSVNSNVKSDYFMNFTAVLLTKDGIERKIGCGHRAGAKSDLVSAFCMSGNWDIGFAGGEVAGWQCVKGKGA